MKRMLTILLLCAVLLSSALAESITLSPELSAQCLAFTALAEKYGVSRNSLGLFSVDIDTEDDGFTVHIRPNSYLPVQRIGEYTVQVSGDTAEAVWTHDDVAPSLWQSGDLDSPAWGEKQLQACLQNSSTAWLAPYLADGPEPETPAVWLDRLHFTRHTPDSEQGLKALGKQSISVERARKLADAALMQVFGMTAEEVAALDHRIDADVLKCEDGRVLWDLLYADSDCCLQILVDAADGQIVHIVIATGGNG